MSRPWRGGYANRRPYGSGNGPRGGPFNQRITRWDTDDHYNEPNGYRGAPVYMNSDSPAFWQDYYNDYPPQQSQQSHQKNYNDSNSWTPSYKTYHYPSPSKGRQYCNQSVEDNRRKQTFNNIEVNLRASPKDRGEPSITRQNSESSQIKATEEPVVAHPGSEAAREKERAEIAERLKQLDKEQEGTKSDAVSKEKNNSSKTSSSSKEAGQRKRNLSMSKSDEKDAKKVKKSNDKLPPISDRSKQTSSRKERSETQQKSKESHTQKNTNVSTGNKKNTVPKASVIPTSGQKRKEILPNVANQKNLKKVPSSKKLSDQNQSTRKDSNQQGPSPSTEKPSDIKNKILSRLSAMGKEELKSLINNPQLPKSQEMLKTLMTCYQEVKALELDKRRFTIASSNTTPEHTSVSSSVTDSGLLNFFDLPSIAMTDLPIELVSQIETFLGFNIGLSSSQNMNQSPLQQIPNNNSLPFQFQEPNNTVFSNQTPPQQFPNVWANNLPTTLTNLQATPEQINQTNMQVNTLVTGEIEQTSRDNISESSTEKAPSPYQLELCEQQEHQFQQPFNTNNFNLPPYLDPLPPINQEDDQTPFMILNELSIIDLRIQADIQRKMQLYKQLHMYLQQNCSRENHQVNVQSARSIVSPVRNISVDHLLPPPPFSNQAIPNQHVVMRNSQDMCVNTVQASSSALNFSEQYHHDPVPQRELQLTANGSQNSKDPVVLTIDDDEDEEDSQLTPPVSSHQNAEVHASTAKRTGCIGCRLLKQSPEKNIVKFPSKIKINDMKVVNKKTVVVACDDDPVIYGYDLDTGKESHKFCEHKSAVTVVLPTTKKNAQKEIVKGQFILCSGSSDELLCFFDSESQLCISKQYLASSITCLEFSPPNILYIGVNCGQIFMCNTDSQQLMGNPMDCGSNSILSILSTREGPRKVLIVSSVGRAIVMRDAQNGLLLRSFQSSWQQKTFTLALYGNLLFAGAMKKCIPYFNLLSGHQEGELNVSGNVSQFTLYKHLLFVACCTGQVCVFDLKTKEKLLELKGSTTTLRSIQIRNNRIVTCGRTKKLEAISFPPEIVRNLRIPCTCK